MRFKAQLQHLWSCRRQINPKYSLRAYARALKVDHSTLSQILKGRRRITARTIRIWGPRLGLDSREIHESCALEHEAAILRIIGQKRFRADSRWLATILNIPLDDVNLALHSLLRKRQLIMKARNEWRRGETDG